MIQEGCHHELGSKTSGHKTKLELVDWYCYDEDLPDDLDVFVFDGIYLTEYLEKGYLLPIPEEAE